MGHGSWVKWVPALGPALLRSSDSVVEDLSLFLFQLLFQPATCRDADDVPSSKLSFRMGDLDTM